MVSGRDSRSHPAVSWGTVSTSQVDTKCWSSNAAIAKWKKSHSKVDLLGYYGDRLVKMVNALNRTVIMWEDLFGHMKASVPSGTVVHVWRDAWQYNMARITGAGYNTILST
jgi:hypothetical protein